MDLNQLKRTFDEVKFNAKELSDIDLITTWRQFGEKQTLWSLNLHNHIVFEKLCAQILSLDREQDENVELVERILACLCMSTRTMQISQSTEDEDKAHQHMSPWQRFRNMLQSCMDKPVDEREALGFQSVLVKCMHLVNTRMRNAAMKIASSHE